MKKLIEKLKAYLPVTKKVYEKDIKNLIIALQGLSQSEAQHSQMEMNLIQKLNSLQQTKSTPDKKSAPKTNFYA